MKKNNPEYKVLARFEKIALDIAYSIYNNEYIEGQLIRGRSTLASLYNVSPETIRRAIKLLDDMHVVESIDKIGIRILSREQAHLFIQEYQSKDQILTLRDTISKLADERERLNLQILDHVDAIIEKSLSLRNIGIIYPLEYKIDPGSTVIGKTIGSIRFWEHTGATIIGINRNGQLYLSPGPNHEFKANDTILYVGNVPDINDKIKCYLDNI